MYILTSTTAELCDDGDQERRSKVMRVRTHENDHEDVKLESIVSVDMETPNTALPCYHSLVDYNRSKGGWPCQAVQ